MGKIRETAPQKIVSAFESGVETSALKADGAIASLTCNMWFSASFTCKLANYLAKFGELFGNLAKSSIVAINFEAF